MIEEPEDWAKDSTRSLVCIHIFGIPIGPQSASLVMYRSSGERGCTELHECRVNFVNEKECP